MNFEKLSELAYKREEISKIANLPQKYAYIQLVDLYDGYKYGNYTKEKSIEIKNKIKKEYESNLASYIENTEKYKVYNKNRIDNTLLLAELEKTTDKNEMIRILLEIVSKCLDDKTVMERNIRKIDN